VAATGFPSSPCRPQHVAASGADTRGEVRKPMTTDDMAADDCWDAGDLGCGPLVLQLRNRLRTMPGRVLKVIARDAGAPIDLPAWCRLTDNELLRHDAAARCFWIRSRLAWD
jgi:tRNA 2-thiouridine synthesizing protein A